MTNQTQQDKFIYLPVYLSDYVSQSRKLTMIQRGALIDLSVLYFQENLKLNYTKEQIYRLVFAFEKQEQEAVDFILENYFTKSENKPMGFYWVSKELDDLGSKILKRLDASRKNGKKGGRGNKSENKPTGLKTDNLDENILNESKLNEIKLNENKNNTDNINISKNNFDEFWQYYTPVIGRDGTFTGKGSKADATKAYEKAIKKFSHEQIMQSLKVYLTSCQKNTRYTKNVASWLNQSMRDNFVIETDVCIEADKPKQVFMTKQELERKRDMEIYAELMAQYGNNGGDNA